MLRIVGWEERFENNRTRDMKSMAWVPLPNKHDGDGYTELLDHANGASHYGAWVAIVQVASKCTPRGTLLRDVGKPHDAASLSRITRIPRSTFDEAIPRLVAIGWLETVTESEQPVTETPQEGAEKPQEPAEHCPRKGRERNGTEGKGNTAAKAARRPPEARAEDLLIPQPLKCEPFIAAWAEWISYRRSRKFTTRAETMSAQLADLAPLGASLAAECMRLSIRNGWQGIFPEKMRNGKPPIVGPGQRHYPEATKRDPKVGVW